MINKKGTQAKKKLATLTQDEDYRWEQLFSWAVNSGLPLRNAGVDAWKGLCEEFPRLNKYKGAKP